MNLWLWFILSCKRQLKNRFFVILLVLLPIALYFLSQTEQKDDGKIKIALYTAEQGIGQQTIDQLSGMEGMFEFYQCRDMQQLEADVASNRAECGYVFTAGLQDKLDQKEIRRCIEVYSSPSTITDGLTKEIVFSCLLEQYGPDLLLRFANSNEFYRQYLDQGILDQLYDQFDFFFQNGSTFSFRYETLSSETIEDQTAAIQFPVRGIAAIYLMVIGIFSAITLKQDEKKGIFMRMRGAAGRTISKIIGIFVPVMLAGGSVYLALIITGNIESIFYEIAALAAYIIIIVAFSYLAHLIVKDPLTLSLAIPFLIIASMVFCPVFIDVSKWYPQIQSIRYLLLPHYYLMFFQ